MAEVWKARKELFGDKAREIWAAEIRLNAISDTLKRIEADQTASLQTKLEMIRTSLRENFRDEYGAAAQNRRQFFLERFLKASQAELAVMTPPDRKSALREIRKTMGLDEDALKRWEDLDAERDRRWENGRNYMNERQTLSLQYSGQELDKRLDDLRLKQFGAEAETIKSEEASGYYRFQKNRILGLE
jgi:hypothetical protein